MILIPTLIAKSKLGGLGCFTAIDIEAGHIVWIWSLSNTYIIDIDEINKPSLFFVNHYGYKIDNKHLAITIDNSAMMNHSDHPNLVPKDLELLNRSGDSLVAIRDIPKGEELLLDYKVFDHRNHSFIRR
jgi:hypothetical protein